MSQALYRKYRSQRFAELIGQPVVVNVLRNSVARGRISHAYLFSGPRGTGKTSVARIFAKALNCQHPQDGDACGQCDFCLSVAEGRAADVVEIDAASNRGIDDVRELRERVNYAPLEFEYKVYIIDEAHMITGPAFNALLKTLEEPPAHVVFCLCTTESHKLPITILSRCIRFDFQPLPQDQLAKHLCWIAEQESYSLAPEASVELARLAEGSARDAISLLDQLMVYCENNITAEAVRELFQLGDPTGTATLVDQLLNGNSVQVLRTWNDLLAQGADAGGFLLEIADELKQRYLRNPMECWRDALKAVWEGLNLLKYESFPALLVELTLLNAQAALAQVSNRATTSIVEGEPALKHGETTQPAGVITTEERPHPQALTTAAQADDETSHWTAFLDSIKQSRLTTYSLLHRGAEGILQDGVLRIVLSAEMRMAYRYIQREENLHVLRQAAKAVFGKDIPIEILLADEKSSKIKLDIHSDAASKNTEVPPDDVLYDVAPKAPAEDASAVDIQKLSQAAEMMTSELAAKQEMQQPPTAKEAMSLFDAVELDEEEHGRESR